jgi:hypothetical protein
MDGLEKYEYECAMRVAEARERNRKIAEEHPEMVTAIRRAWSEIDLVWKGLGSPMEDAAVRVFIEIFGPAWGKTYSI